MNSFSDIKTSVYSSRRLLRTDWSKEEEFFKSNIKLFFDSISHVNVKVLTLEKKTEIIEGTTKDTVESNSDGFVSLYSRDTDLKSVQKLVSSVSNCGILETGKDREVHILEKNIEGMDPFDFDDSNKNTSTLILSKDPFDVERTSSSTIPSFLGDNILSSDSIKLERATLEKYIICSNKKTGEGELLEGFDFSKFEEAKGMASKMLCKYLSNELNIDAIREKIPSYSVSLKIDSYASDPGLLADKLVEIQAFRDSINSEILRLIPVVNSMKNALDILFSVGDLCSKASSEKKRRAQVEIIIIDLYSKYKDVSTVLEQLEKSYFSLNSQFDTVSRLITWYQQFFPKSISKDYLETKHKVVVQDISDEKENIKKSELPIERIEKENLDTIPKDIDILDKFTGKVSRDITPKGGYGEIKKSGFVGDSLDF